LCEEGINLWRGRMVKIRELIETLQKQEDQEAEVVAMVDDTFDMPGIILYITPDESTPDEKNVICRF